ncbi:MAG: ATP-binding cassette domain-containing protein [Clostridiales bacterium]|nr:ATP-binding cassette domain-containing protein [Clostridiales bacterium]
MIKLENITKEYDRTILNNINFNFEYGKIYLIKGVSGCGKTTLLNILGLIDSDYLGKYVWDNVQQITDKSVVRDKIGYIFQNSLLISNMTVMDNLLFIKNDITLIHNYSQQLDIDNLLKKYPNELSGGERSRVSIVRALLSNPQLILADEPSASLDNDNSIKLAKIFAKISTNNNIIIISTHEDCFDNIANVIIHLDYGNISNIEIKNSKKTINHLVHNEENEQRRKLFKYVLRKNKFSNFSRNILLSFMLFLILLCIGLQQNIQNILIDRVYANYPMNTFTISEYGYEEYKDTYDLKIFENYQFKQDNFTCYILTDAKYSGFSCPGVLAYGTFPKEQNEVIVNQEFINNNFSVSNYKDCVGKEIIINNYHFTISGILNDLTDSELYNLVYYFDYYRLSENTESVYVPYDSLKEFGNIESSDMLMVACDNLYNTSAYKELREYFGGSISPWDSAMLNVQSIINSIVAISLLAIFVIIILSMIFVTNEIKLDLFFRKREFGYLQIFGISKNEIMKIIFLEKLLQIFVSYFCAALFYFIVAVVINIGWNFIIFFNPVWIVVVGLLISLYVFIVTFFPTNKFLKFNIIDLIR